MEINWVGYSLISALFLGAYDIFKKQSVQKNAVIPVLFFSVCVGSLVWMPATIASQFGYLEDGFYYVGDLDLRGHVELFGKALLVAASWVFGYFALKNLPVSLVGPIRSTSPLWTLLGAVVFLHERPVVQQWIGILVTLFFFLGLSFAGRKEGVYFHRNKWVFAIIAATFLGAASALFDRYLLGVREYSAAVVQAWFSHYLVIVFTPIMIAWKRRWWIRGEFYWRWSIPFIALSLLVGDYFYFIAMGKEDALVSVISSLRRGAVIIPFMAGFFLFKERNFFYKIPCVIGILFGIILIVTST